MIDIMREEEGGRQAGSEGITGRRAWRSDHQSGPCILLDMQTDDLPRRLLSAGAGEDACCTGENVRRGGSRRHGTAGGLMKAVPAAGLDLYNLFNITFFM